MDTSPDPWPLRGVRLRTADLVLRPMVEGDLDAVVDTLADDVGLDPTLPRFPGLDVGQGRSVATHQMYWRSLGTWSVDRWRLPFVVTVGETIVGVQELEAEDLATSGTVDSSSHLRPDVRGRGWGTQARRAVLALAFGPLGARRAITSAWHHNRASLGVTRAVGYRFSHDSQDRTDDQTGLDTMRHFGLAAADWHASGQGASVEIEGFEPCRPLFGLPHA